MKGMKSKGMKIKGKKLTATLLIAIFILTTLAIAIPLVISAGTSVEPYYPTLVIHGDSLPTWVTWGAGGAPASHDGGLYGVKLDAGTVINWGGGSRAIMHMAPTTLTDDEPTVWAKGVDVSQPPLYFNILIDTDGDGIADDMLEGQSSSPGITNTWQEITANGAYYDDDDSLGLTGGGFVYRSLTEWIAHLGTDPIVVGVQVVYGVCDWNDGQIAYIDDITLGSPTEDFETRITLDYEYYKMDDAVKASIFDVGLNTRTAFKDSGDFDVASDVGDQITVDILETGFDTSVFEGTFTIADTPGVNELEVEDEDTITAAYTGATPDATATIDLSDPTMTSDADLDAKRINDESPVITVGLGDATSGLSLATMKLDGETVAMDATISGPAGEIEYEVPEFEPLDEGSYTVEVTVSDVVGHIFTDSFTFTVDLTKPTISIDIDDDPVDGAGAIFTLTFNEDMDPLEPTVTFGKTSPYTSKTVTGSWDGESLRVWIGTKTASTSDGLNTLSVSGAKDIAGNTMLADTITTFTIDSEAPSEPDDLIAVATDVSITLTWTASTDVDGTGVEFYKIYRETDSSVDTSATPIDTLASTITTYVDFGPLSEATYYYVVQAVDCATNTADSETVSVAFTPGDVIVYPIELYEGWNLISLPLIPDDPDIEVVLEDVWDNVQIVYGYDQDEDDWIMNPDEMTHGWGYWIYLNEDDTLIVEGTETIPGMGAPVTYEYTEGWVLGGYKQITPSTEYFRSFEADTYFDYIYVWDASELDWTMLPVTTEDPNKGLVALNPGQGFWIYMYEDQVLIPPVTTP